MGHGGSNPPLVAKGGFMTNDDIFGVAIPKCYFCGKDKNEIIMTTLLTKENARKVKKAHGKVIDKTPCDECKKYMEQGVILIEVKDDDPEYRLGGFVVITEDGIKNIFPEEEAKTLLKMRAGFIGETLWKRIGLPTGE